jgi:hypothetical protein
MEAGFIPDHHVQINPSCWHPGTPSQRTRLGNLKLDPALMISITTYRCTRCGLLRQYARK